MRRRGSRSLSLTGEEVLVGQPRLRGTAGVSVSPTMLLIDRCRVGGGVNASNRTLHEKSSKYVQLQCPIYGG